MQLSNQARFLKLLKIDNKVCPYNALKRCLQLVPGGKNQPLFQFRLNGSCTPLTDNQIRRHLKKNVLSLMGKQQNFITFHSFRRSSASLSFKHNVPLQDIQRHGTWTSDAVYVTDIIDVGCQVADTFASQLM